MSASHSELLQSTCTSEHMDSVGLENTSIQGNDFVHNFAVIIHNQHAVSEVPTN